MPVAIIKYTCQFRCGKKATGKESVMSAHEHNCWKSPSNKTCKTCSNEVYERDSDEYRGSYSRGCKISSLNNVLENTEEFLKHHNNAHARPVFKCAYWNKEDDGNSQLFADLLEAEIKSEKEGTEHYPFYDKPSRVEKYTAEQNLPF